MPKPAGHDSWTLKETGSELSWQPPVDWPTTEEVKWSDNTDWVLSSNTWDESNQTWTGIADKMVDNVYVKCTYVWNKSTKVWDRD